MKIAWRLSFLGFAGAALTALTPTGCAGSSDDGGVPSTSGRGGGAGTGSGGSTFGGAPALEECFSPAMNPELALDPNTNGCECSSGEACVRVQGDRGPRDLAFVCENGRWASAEDGLCAPQTHRETACKVLGRVYASGSTSVPDPHSCNTCSCDDGELVDCTNIGCPRDCPPNGLPGTQCAECGPTDACLVVEHGCFPVCTESEHCNGGACLDGLCRSLCG